MMPQHHPAEELLIDYAAGSMGEPMALLLATHLTLCPQCRGEAARLDALGGALLESLEPEPVSDTALQALLDQLDSEPESPPIAKPEPKSEDGALLPRPLMDYIGGPLSAVRWQRFGGLSIAELEVGGREVHTRLMRIASGMAMPRHTHEGNELTLVLSGGFSDSRGHYLRGDVATTDSSVDHQPVADADGDCLCLAVTDAPLRLTGRFGRMLNPFFRF
tara:strand:+ start:1702 stop:2358 length:657 start_codon:yes stop_codon:yes gene_type:complete